ncbi:hypothetical protein K6119_07255 [Paracrocinitomix mangrovi]|uniref:hypothetical protein n=1 Tax=Paracrocinitomix mangrovi TaxID=2862509 RepID=UPI001C8E7308|nr:hypothetical protein [Paracrocinitomix mangrovi]UKN03310.1 hypothetical protein K6119_07255 [Paracrocinitomix mangrovi]
MSTTYDRIYIGSGPINIIDTHLHAKKGQKILIVDDKQQIGGAWVAIPVGEYGNLEIGCHIWSYNQNVYKFLNDILEIELVPLKPQPYFKTGNSKLIYDHKNLLLTSKRVTKDIITGKFKQASAFIKTNPAARFPLVPKTYLYPKGGAREFQEALQALVANNSNIQFKFGEKVNTIEFDQGNWNLITSSGETYQTKSLILTSTSNINVVKYGDTTIAIKHRNLNYTHYHLVFKGQVKKKVSYVRVLKDDLIHRVSDITNQLSDASKDISVLLVGVFDSKIKDYSSEEEVKTAVHKYLRDNKIISDDNELLFAQLNRFPTEYINKEQRVQINNLEDSIELIHTTDLIYGFYYRMQDWKKKGLI